MTYKESISRLRKDPKDGWYYIQGSLRLAAYRRAGFKWLLRKHIIEQFEWRRDVAAKPCFLAGQCYCCECETPALFLADKGCSAEKFWHCQEENRKQCYPAMMSRKKWQKFKNK